MKNEKLKIKKNNKKVDVYEAIDFGDVEEAEELAKELLGVETSDEMNQLIDEHAKVLEK